MEDVQALLDLFAVWLWIVEALARQKANVFLTAYDSETPHGLPVIIIFNIYHCNKPFREQN